MSLDQDIYGTTPPGYDENNNQQSAYYKFTTANMDGVTYTAKTVATGSVDLGAYICDSNYEKVDPIDSKYNRNFGADAGKGYSSVFKLKKNTTYYVELYAEYTSKSAPYMLRIQKNISKPSKPVIDYLKAGKKKFTIKYYKVNYASKYQIRYKIAGDTWSKAKDNGKKLKYTKTGLKSGKKYSVQVRAIRTVDGKNYTGKWSSTKTIKVK